MLYLKLWFSADGTPVYGQAIRWCYLLGLFGKDPKATRKMERLDKRISRNGKRIPEKALKTI